MTLLRISPTTSSAFDSLKARINRVQTAASGVTTTTALAQARQDLAALSREAKGLQLALGQEIAEANRREREDRAVRKVG